LKAGVINAKNGKPIDEEFKKYMKQLLISVWSVTSELIFAGASSHYGYKVCFDIAHKGHDYDFMVNENPCQVKTIIPDEQQTKEIGKKVNCRIDELRTYKKIDEEEVTEAILHLLRDNQQDIKKAIEQRGRIICVNGTLTYVGFLLNQWASDNNHKVTIEKAMLSSINLLKEGNVNIVSLTFGATAIDYNYRFSTWSFKVSITDTLNISNIDMIKRI
jgi:hypothetical protein